MMTHACNPNTKQGKAGGLQIWTQPAQFSNIKTQSQKKILMG